MDNLLLTYKGINIYIGTVNGNECYIFYSKNNLRHSYATALYTLQHIKKRITEEMKLNNF